MQIDLTKPESFETGARFPKLELKKDETARICMLSSKGIEAALVHWVTRVGYVHCLTKTEKFGDLREIERNGGNPEQCILCRYATETKGIVSPPLRHFAAKVLRYRTDANGNMPSSGLQYWFEIWVFSNKKFSSIIQMQKEWGNLASHDITLTCTETTYYSMDIEIKKDAWWLQKKDDVVKFWKEESAKYDLTKCLGEAMPEDAIKRRFASINRRNTPEEEAVDLGGSVLAGEDKTGKVNTTEDFEALLSNDKEKTVVKDPAGATLIPKAVEKKEVDQVNFLDNLLAELETEK